MLWPEPGSEEYFELSPGSRIAACEAHLHNALTSLDRVVTAQQNLLADFVAATQQPLPAQETPDAE